jgi:hypothetical protein
MKPWRSKLLLLGGAAALALAIPALGQEAPESLLPPGFGEPDAPPPPPQQQTPPPGTPAPSATPGGPAGPVPPQRRAPPPRQPVISSGEEDLAALEALLPDPIEIPEASRRPVEIIGPLGPENGGLGMGAFGNANGRLLSTLMRRLDAPLPSRWTSILLRRALLTRAPAPSYVNPVDWTAERAWLLLRMGEADAARLLVQSVDVDRFTPKMFTVAVQSSLANADPLGLCPLIDPGRKTSDEPVWALGDAMCAALEGEPAKASTLMGQARRRSLAPAIDLTLAEKVIGAGENTRRAVTVQWDDVAELNSWRFGLASATGIQIPEPLMNGAGSHVHAWLARAPMIPLEQRVMAAQVAASLGVFSSASLVEMHSLLADETDPSELAETVGGRLRLAYAGRTLSDRLGALRGLWEEGETPLQRHARRILTATAAARIPATEAAAGDAGELIASMLTAGYDRRAAEWSDLVGGLDEGGDADLAWALLALASPDPSVDVGTGRIGAYAGRDDSDGKLRSKMLAAGLAGLGRLDPDSADDLGVNTAAANAWTRQLDRAVQDRQPGSVALLAAIGMQTGGWAGVPPEHLYHIVSALRRVGLEYEARMIAAEAVARL